MEVLADGLGFPESVRWHDGRAWCCDWGSGRVLAGGEVVAQLPPDTLPLSIDWTPAGELLVVDGPRRRVLREGEELAMLPGDGPLNEIAAADDGAIYVNGGPYVFRLGDDRPLLDGLLWPNGMAILGRELVVADSHAQRLIAVDVDTRERRVWADLDTAPDGICAAPDGTIWLASVPARACLRVAEGGEVRDRVDVDRGCFSCALGDGVLYIGAAEWHGMDHLQAHGPGSSGRLLACPGRGSNPH